MGSAVNDPIYRCDVCAYRWTLGTKERPYKVCPQCGSPEIEAT